MKARDLPFIEKIISGGQTGADRAALDTAIELGIDHGGWVPLGRSAEDGHLAGHYRVQETATNELEVRTEWNVRDSDATLILSHGRLCGGSLLTKRMARKHKKPAFHVDFDRLDEPAAVSAVRDWLSEVRPATLNVAGPRESKDPAIYQSVFRLLHLLFLG